jgi:hypothetical protein
MPRGNDPGQPRGSNNFSGASTFAIPPSRYAGHPEPNSESGATLDFGDALLPRGEARNSDRRHPGHLTGGYRAAEEARAANITWVGLGSFSDSDKAPTPDDAILPRGRARVFTDGHRAPTPPGHQHIFHSVDGRDVADMADEEYATFSPEEQYSIERELYRRHLASTGMSDGEVEVAIDMKEAGCPRYEIEMAVQTMRRRGRGQSGRRGPAMGQYGGY